MERMEERQLFATFVVTNTSDTGVGSLRDAITKANKTAAHDTIQFKIGSGLKTITPAKALPQIMTSMTLDGTTQPGYDGSKPLIEIRGDKAGGNGFVFHAGNNGVKGLIINRFSGNGMILITKGNNSIKGNWIGLDNTGTKAAPNGGQGIVVQSTYNTIGGTTAKDRNVISGNKGSGIQFWTGAGSYNTVSGNYIGTDYTGSKDVGNLRSGIGSNYGHHNTIGGSVAGAGNVISGNDEDGIVIMMSGASYNQIKGNIIGLNAKGDTRLANKWYGIEISQPYNTVGGTTPLERNIVSGNEYSGVVLWKAGGSNNTVIGNYIGTDITGKKDIGNWLRGVDVSNGSSNNTIGGYSSGQRNVISGNDAGGVMVYQGTNNKFIKNYVGLAADGVSKLGNFSNGFSLAKADRVTLDGNLVGYNSGHGVHNGSSTNTLLKYNKFFDDILFLVKQVA
jgi:hypothetical protein